MGCVGGRRGGGGRTVGRGVLEKDLIESSSDSDASDGCRPRKVSADVFRDNSLSEGGKMKELGKVIKRCQEELKRPENVNCRVESFRAIINKFDEDKRKLVKEMGFAGLYALVDRQLPRELCYWLASQVDVNSRSMVTVDGKEFRFGAA